MWGTPQKALGGRRWVWHTTKCTRWAQVCVRCASRGVGDREHAEDQESRRAQRWGERIEIEDEMIEIEDEMRRWAARLGMDGRDRERERDGIGAAMRHREYRRRQKA